MNCPFAMSPDPGTTVPAKDCDTILPLIGLIAARLLAAHAWLPGTPFGRQNGRYSAAACLGFHRSGSNAEFMSRVS